MSILLYSMRLFIHHRRYRGDVSLLAMLSCKCTSLHIGTHILQKQYISILMYRCNFMKHKFNFDMLSLFFLK